MFVVVLLSVGDERLNRGMVVYLLFAEDGSVEFFCCISGILGSRTSMVKETGGGYGHDL